MKKFISKFVAIIAILLSGFMISNAQVVIKVRPGPPVVRVRPVTPGPRHIWVDGEYAWRGGTYVYTDGYWAVPPSRRTHWKAGHWKHRRDGWIWIPGRWR
ncbi:MAG: hypothetical protein ABIN36_01485 [Ferruginibacter sp.]